MGLLIKVGPKVIQKSVEKVEQKEEGGDFVNKHMKDGYYIEEIN